MDSIRIALDWTANTNHTGFYVAQELGYYREKNLQVQLITPNIDNYAITPVKKLELGQVDFALAPTESVISYQTKSSRMEAVAVATLFQKDMSAIVTLSTSRIMHPQALDGKIYASYKARYEDTIVRQMIINDGGKGDLIIKYPKKLGIWNTLLKGQADATWIFLNWEGIEAQTQGLNLNTFQLADYQIPYSYSPVIISNRQNINQRKAVYRSFLDATRQGFLYAQANPEESAKILTQYVPETDQKNINILESQLMTSPHYGKAENWGKMEESKMQEFIDWLIANNLEKGITQAQSIFSNELL